MRIYLVGYMGSGKSTLGRRLAKVAGMDYIDLDKFIEARNCRTIPQLFEQEGEECFRKKERKALEEVSEFDNVIVATGGGAPCFFDNMELMNRTGITVFLDIEPHLLARRLSISKTVRPLISNKSKEELEIFVYENLTKRRPFYEQSAVRITDPESDPKIILQMIHT